MTTHESRSPARIVGPNPSAQTDGNPSKEGFATHDRRLAFQ
jgi:hypothetical protein